MARRLDVLYPHESTNRDGKKFTNWYRVGNAHEGDRGDITVYVRVLPAAPIDGEYKLVLREAKSHGPQGGGDEGMGF